MNTSPETEIPKIKTKKQIILITSGVAALWICFLIGIGVVSSLLLGQIKKGGNGPFISPTIINPTGVNTGIGPINNDAPACNLPKVTFPENAFYIGVPNGWIYEINDGTVSIMQDDTNTTAAFLYTASLKNDIPVQDFLQKFSQVFSSTVSSAGGTFTTGTPVITTTRAEASLVGTVDKVTMSGKLIAEKENGFIILRSYWAPSSELSEQETLLKQIVGCFGRNKILTEEILSNIKNNNITSSLSTNTNTNSTMESYKGKYFKFLKPANFKVTAETDSGLDMTRTDGNAGFSYAYATGFVGSYDPKSWAQKALPEYAKILNLSLSDGTTIPSQISGFNVQAFNFTGKLQGTIPVKGMVTVGILKAPYYGFGTPYTSAFWAIQIATPEVWPSVSSTLQAVLDSFEITDIGTTRKNTKLPPNRPMESTSGSSITSKLSEYSSVSDEVSENWAEAMRGYTTATDSTGGNHDVPLNSFNPTGPQGPGYYLNHSNGTQELLTTRDSAD